MTRISLVVVIICMLHFDMNATSVNTKSILSDSLKQNKIVIPPNPKFAALMSLVMPGGGQLYNGRYWKLPIIYAAYGTAIYFIQFNSKETNKFKEAYLLSKEGKTPPGFPPGIQPEAYLNQYKYHRSNLELSYVSLGIIHLVQVLEAYVDAHLHTFDITDDLSVAPQLQLGLDVNQPLSFTPGVSMRLQF